MNKLGIIGAMEEEISMLKEKMTEVETSIVAKIEFCQGFLQGKSVVVVRSGIGKVNAAICTQILIDIYQVDGIINTGIAGSLKNEINIGDVVLSIDTLQHDMDATHFGYDVGVIPRMETSIFKADDGLIQSAKQVCIDFLPDIGVHIGRIVSGDQFIGDDHKKQWLAKTFGGYCTEMEGAAIAHTAYLNNVPFLIIRAISDKADHSAQVNYEEFEGLAIKNAVTLVTNLMNIL